jgi:hypothetical protein
MMPMRQIAALLTLVLIGHHGEIGSGAMIFAPPPCTHWRSRRGLREDTISWSVNASPPQSSCASRVTSWTSRASWPVLALSEPSGSCGPPRRLLQELGLRVSAQPRAADMIVRVASFMA